MNIGIGQFTTEVHVPTPMPSTPVSFTDTTSESSSSLKSSDAAWEVVAYQKSGIGEGQYTANPWLQELPDAITKVCWDNYVTMAPADCYDLFNITGMRKVNGMAYI